jgi:hypothetical protein
MGSSVAQRAAKRNGPRWGDAARERRKNVSDRLPGKETILEETPVACLRSRTIALTLCRKGRDICRYDRGVVVGAELPSAGVTYYEVRRVAFGKRKLEIHVAIKNAMTAAVIVSGEVRPDDVANCQGPWE